VLLYTPFLRKQRELGRLGRLGRKITQLNGVIKADLVLFEGLLGQIQICQIDNIFVNKNFLLLRLP
jgi:hypothetical protein